MTNKDGGLISPNQARKPDRASLELAREECVVAERRAKLTDDDFWADVFGREQYEAIGSIFDPRFTLGDWDEDPDLDGMTSQNEPCTECGETAACGYDLVGRPMYHRQRDDEEE